MRTLEKKISKIKDLNDKSISNLFIADQLMEDKNLSLDNAITVVSTAKDKNKLIHLRGLYEKLKGIEKILDIFDERRIEAIQIRIKKGDSTSEILEEPLRKIENEITNKIYGILTCLKEKRDDQSKSADFYNVIYDIEKNYKTILNLIKRIVNKWYKFITSKSLIITFISLTSVSLIVFFFINMEFHKEQTTSKTVLVTVQERVQDIKVISNDKSLNFFESVAKYYDLITKTISIIPQVSLLLTIIVWVLRQFFIKNKGLSRVANKLNEFYKVTKGQS